MFGYFNYNAGSEAGTNWTNESYAWDGVYYGFDAATRIVAANTDETTKWVKCETIGTTLPSDTILKVYAVVLYSSTNTSVKPKFCPVFGGSTDGDTYELTGVAGGAYSFTDITTSTNAPSTWTWTDVQNLDIRLWGKNTSATTPYQLSIIEIGLYIEHQTNHYIYYRKSSTTYSGLLYADNTGMMRSIGIKVDDDDYSNGTYFAQIKSDGDLDLSVRDGGSTYKINSVREDDCTDYRLQETSTNSTGYTLVSATATNDRLYLRKVMTHITASGTLKQVYFCNETTGSVTLKCLLFSSTGTILYNSGELVINTLSGVFVPKGLPSGGYALTANTYYYLGYIIKDDTSGQTTYTVMGAFTGGYIANDYDTPANFNTASISNNTYAYRICGVYKVAT